MHLPPFANDPEIFEMTKRPVQDRAQDYTPGRLQQSASRAFYSGGFLVSLG